MKISVIGSGGWGTAISALLCRNGHAVTLWSWKQEESDAIASHKENKEFLPGISLPEGITYTADLEKAVFAEMVVIATPSAVLPKTVQSLAALLPAGIPIVNLTKGLSADTNERFSEVIRRLCPHNPVVILTGPSHAEEVGRQIPTTVVAASENTEAAALVQDVFMSPCFRVYTTQDVIGAELGGALKNVIALCAGIMDGLGFGDNTKAALMTRGLAEMSRLGMTMGANPATFAGLSGIGDLIVTCTSMHSRNRRAGILIGQGKSVREALDEVHTVVEGVYAAESAYKLATKHHVEMPIVAAAYRVLFENASPREEVLTLMRREKKKESEII
ncbi:MAG: NAD(P)H-dependent glycerol-3-phosphate dehydrogenase [Ruminococcaceae bacterium]|nr:NAD(P)H-dependent glycerol-3-phosphate dehydrogenase [Oscillospiraceae bacterium]